MNLDTITSLEQQKIPAVYGDITREDILKAAGIQQAALFIITVPSAAAAAEAAIAAKHLNPNLTIYARTRFLQDRPLLEDAGVNHILYEEHAIAETLAEFIKSDLSKAKSDSCQS